MTTLSSEGANAPSNTGEPISGGIGVAIEGRTPLQLAWIRLKRDRVAMAAGITIIVLIVIAFLAVTPLYETLFGHDQYYQDRDRGLNASGIPQGPSKAALLGYDSLGRDILVRIIYGAQVSLFIGVVSTSIALFIGVMIGMFAGYFGGKTDMVLSGFMDVILSFPFLLTALVLVAIFDPSVYVSIGIIAFFGWVYIARIVRGQVLSLREKEFVEAARSLGASDLRIMFGDILPNLVAPIIVYATLLIPANILAEASLSFLGLGVKPPTPTWGQMLAESFDHYTSAWWFFLFPGLALLITVLAFNLLGDGLRDALDPRATQTLSK